jgi:hypothetical protein
MRNISYTIVTLERVFQRESGIREMPADELENYIRQYWPRNEKLSESSSVVELRKNEQVVEDRINNSYYLCEFEIYLQDRERIF